MPSGKFEPTYSLTLSYFISPHGFGHAARAAAVMAAVQVLDPRIRFEIFTTIPKRFFEESLLGPFGYHAQVTDVGLVQKDPLCADLPETLARLDEFLPFDGGVIKHLAETVSRLNCAMVLCDISPMGIAVARKAGVPSLLVENFTWDWVYGEYVSQMPGFKAHMDYLEPLFSHADYHVQASPVCKKRSVHLTTGPICRRPRQNRRQVRARLGIPHKTPMVLITMGGIPKEHLFMDQLSRQNGIFFVVPGSASGLGTSKNVISLPHHSAFYHPDLVGAADAVVGKVGYSTLSEIYHAEVPFGYIKRGRFQESEILAAYVEKYMAGFAIDENEFERGEWLLRVPQLLDLPVCSRKETNGAQKVANFLLETLNAP